MVGIEEIQLLKRAIEQYAIDKRGEFDLSSGNKTNYYCTLRNVTQRPDYAEIIGELMAPAVIASGAQGVGGMVLGAVPIAQAIGAAAKKGGFIIPGFSVRPEPKDHGSEEQSGVSASVAADGGILLREGRRLAVVEDTITTGGSALKAIEAVESLGCRVVLVHVVVERHEMGGHRFRELGVPFKRLFYTDERGQLYVDQELSQMVNT